MKMLGWTMTIAGAAVLAVWLLVTVTPIQADTPSGVIALIGGALLVAGLVSLLLGGRTTEALSGRHPGTASGTTPAP